MFERLLKGRHDRPAPWSAALRDEFTREEIAFSARADRRSAEFIAFRSEILLAGGVSTERRPSETEGRDAAIQRLLQEGQLRETITFGAFPMPRTYRYTLTPNGERTAAMLKAAAA